MSLPDPYPFRTTVKVIVRDGHVYDRHIETREVGMDKPQKAPACKAYVVEPQSGKGPKRVVIAPDAMTAARIFVAAVKGPVVYTVNDLIHREVPQVVMDVPTNVIGIWVPGEHVRAALGWGPEDLRSAADIAAGRAGPSFR